LKRIIVEAWTTSAKVGEKLIFTFCLGSSHGVITRSARAEICIEPPALAKIVKGLENGKISTGSNEIIIETSAVGNGLLVVAPEEESGFPGIQIMFRVSPKPTDKRSRLKEGEEPTGPAILLASKNPTPPAANDALRALATTTPPGPSNGPTVLEDSDMPQQPPAAPPADIIKRIDTALKAANIDATAGLKQEAIELARGGLLAAARNHLHMLLCLDPENGEARLLLAKVYMGMQCWPDAQAQADAANTLGMSVPDFVQINIDAGIEAEREQAEVKNKLAAANRKLDNLGAEFDKARADGYKEGYDKAKPSFLLFAFLVLCGLIIGGGTIGFTWWTAPGYDDGYAQARSEDQATVIQLQMSISELRTTLADAAATPEPVAVAPGTAETETEPPPATKSGCTVENAKITDLGGDLRFLQCFEEDVYELWFCRTGSDGSVDPDTDSCTTLGAYTPRTSGCTNENHSTVEIIGAFPTKAWTVTCGDRRFFCEDENGDGMPDPDTAECAEVIFD